MHDDELREILGRVAAGELDADEAARLLDPDRAAVEDEDEDEVDDDVFADERFEDRSTSDDPGPGDVARELRVSGVTRKLLITGDPTVREVLVRGAPVRRENGILVVESQPEEFIGDSFARGFAMVHAGPWTWEGGRHGDRRRERWERFEGRDRRPRPPFGPVEIRANPDLALTLDLTASNARVSGMHGKITTSLTAGSAVLRDARGPFDCTVAAGSLAIDGPIARGDSRISCDMGSVKLRLRPGSDVRIRVDATMGKHDVQVGAWADRGEDGEWIVGDGKASLDILATMSSVKIYDRP